MGKPEKKNKERDKKKKGDDKTKPEEPKFKNPEHFKGRKFSGGGKPNPAKNSNKGFSPGKFKIQHRG